MCDWDSWSGTVKGQSPGKGQLEIWTKHTDDGRLLWLFTPQYHHKTRQILGPFILLQVRD